MVSCEEAKKIAEKVYDGCPIVEIVETDYLFLFTYCEPDGYILITNDVCVMKDTGEVQFFIRDDDEADELFKNARMVYTDYSKLNKEQRFILNIDEE